MSAGICPKSKTIVFEGKEIDLPITAPNFLCSESDSTKYCHFPFLYKGEVEWDSVKDSHGKCKCSTDTAGKLEDLKNHETFDSLTDCRNCSSGN